MPQKPDTARYEQAQLARRITQLHALHRIGMAMASVMKPSAIVQMVLTEVVSLTKADKAILYLRDQQLQQLVPTSAVGMDGLPPPLDLIDSDDLPVEVAHTGIGRQVRCPCGDTPGGESQVCRLAVPLVAGEEVLGVIDLQARRCEPFDPDLEEMLGTLASQAALVFRNAITHEELEQHYRELSLLYDIQQEITSTFDSRKILSRIVERARDLFDARECTIRLLVEHDSRRFVRIAATTGRQFIGPEQIPVEESYVDRHVLGGDMLFMEDVRTDPRFLEQETAVQLGVVGLLCAPLVAKGRTIGTIRLYTGERRDFSVADRKMLLALAGQAAVAIENARLYRRIEAQNRQLQDSYEVLRRTQKELIQKERLAALGEMAATVAHEIRNPLTSVRGFAQRIARRADIARDGRLADYTGIIMEEVDRLNKFIKDVLDFARRVKPSFEKVNLNRILSDIVNLISEELDGQDVMVIPALDMNLRETVVDSSLIKQMLLNIMQNARQALGPKGVIMIRTQNSGAYVRIRIADNGQGISRENLQKVWSPFFTTKTQGTGLGLALVQRIVDDHHGKIHVRSRVGAGTIVDIFLPIVESEDGLLQFATS